MPVQRYWWSARHQGIPVRAEIAALRVIGLIDDERLTASIRAVIAHVPALTMGVVVEDGAPQMVVGKTPPSVSYRAAGGNEEFCVDLLRADRDRRPDPGRDPLVRFHVVRAGADDVILGLVADPLVLDQRSLYLVLGAVMRAYVGRMRGSAMPPHVDIAMAGLDEHMPPARRNWWLRRLTSWGSASVPVPPDRHGPMRTLDKPLGWGTASRVLRIDASRWAKLAGLVDDAGNAGWLTILAIVTLWLRAQRGGTGAPIFTSTLDLREYRGLGSVVGPLTDWLPFDVELQGVDQMTFAGLVRRVHAGLLDAVVHYVPYVELVGLAREAGLSAPPRTGSGRDIVVHYCRTPLTSATTRGEGSLAREGLSIELFRESELAAGGPLGSPVEVRVAESGDGMAVVVNYATDLVESTALDALITYLGGLIDAVIADPAAPVHRLMKMKEAGEWTMTTAFSTG